MKRNAIHLLLVLLAASAAGACNHSSDGNSAALNATVKTLIQTRTTETGTPIEVNGTSFSFSDDEHALDVLLPADTGAVVPQ